MSIRIFHSYEVQLSAAAEHLAHFLDSKEKEVIGTTYKELRDMVAGIHKCGYFDRVSVEEKEEVEAEEQGEGEGAGTGQQGRSRAIRKSCPFTQRGQFSSTEVWLKVAMSAAVTPDINNIVYYRSLNVGIASS